MLRQILPAAALFTAALITGCAQTGEKAAPAVTEAAAETGPWRPFSAASPWNTPIAANAPIDPNSDVLMGEFANLNALHINMPEWSVSVYPVDAATPKKTVQGLYADSYGPGFGPNKRIPIPEGASPAGPDGGTGFLVLEDRKAGKAWEMRQAGQYENGNWFAGFGAEIDLRGTGVNAPWMQALSATHGMSPRASGAPLVAGLIRVEELKAGRIDHALAFAYPIARTGAFVPPASTALEAVNGRIDNPFGLPMGARIQLDPSYDIENTLLSPEGKVIARALQEYGAILVDDAGATVLFAEAAPAQLTEWEGVMSPDELHLLFTPEFMSKNFRVLEIGPTLAGKPVQRR